MQLPKGHHVVTPGAQVQHAVKVLTFVEQAFGGEVLERYDTPDGLIAHSEIMIGDSVVMFGDVMGDSEARPAILSVYVEDAAAVDATYQRALRCGATSLAEPADQFYGHRSASVEDAGGNHWTITAVVETLSVDEINTRMQEIAEND